jgi:RNA-directed DNA polymerase
MTARGRRNIDATQKSDKAMATDLTRIGTKARREPKLVFSSLYHHIYDIENLRAAYDSLERRKAVGIDGVDKDTYGKDLEGNLADLSKKLREMAYRPAPSRRTYIPKSGSAKGRPLGISSFENKIVEKAIKNTLEQIYEADFEESSYGYRPECSQHDCLDKLGRTIQQEKVSYVVEADIRSFFDKVNHAWLMKFLAHRIGDKRLLRLIERFLKAGVLEDGLVKASDEGTPQGSILSPLLSNVYLHYVLDLWFNKRVAKRLSRGESSIFRYADDFVACFQYKDDAYNFQRLLRERLEGFNLELAEEKTQTLEFGRFARSNAKKRGEKPKGFTFLGFDHYCGNTKEGHFKVKRRTNRSKLQSGLKKFMQWCERSRRWMPKGEMMRRARARIAGHLNYYAITDNSPRCGEYIYHATRILFKWLNRKSQRNSYTWEGYGQALRKLNWPTNGVRKDLNPCRR